MKFEAGVQLKAKRLMMLSITRHWRLIDILFRAVMGNLRVWMLVKLILVHFVGVLLLLVEINSVEQIFLYFEFGGTFLLILQL